MVFSSLEFLFLFFPITLLCYFIVPKKWIKARNVVLLTVSLIFYGWGEPLYVFLMIASVIFSYFYGYMVGKHRINKPKKAKFYLILAIITNIGLLGVFKYTDFFISLLNYIPNVQIPKTGIALPIGISFYTFQILSYVIDVYRGDTPSQKNLLSLGTYVTLFPQLIAGPIVRYKDVDDQLHQRTSTLSLFSSGIRTFLAGLFKKVLLANAAGEAFKLLNDAHLTTVGAWLGLLFYFFQIYFDFSGYSDMAIGLGKMFGFRFLENFNYPYIAKSVTDFWRRWHISLSTWFKEYLYFPLGGSRTDKKYKVYRNLLIVWLATGFWHGASFNFILWGLWYFLFLVIEKTFLLKKLEKLPSVFGHIYTLLVVYFGWFLFYFEDFKEGFSYLQIMFGMGKFCDHSTLFMLLSNLVLLCFLVISSTPLPKKIFYRLYQKNRFTRILLSLLSILLFLVSVASLVNSSFNPFLYFRF